jgi:outer membrane protein assembly factor BamE
MRFLAITLIAASLVAGTGCSGNIFSIHRIDIEQGNIVDPAAVNELSPGMTRKQVTALLGHPVLQPVLNPDRWEYVYYKKLPDKPVEKQVVVVHFAGDKVTRVSKND